MICMLMDHQSLSTLLKLCLKLDDIKSYGDSIPKVRFLTNQSRFGLACLTTQSSFFANGLEYAFGSLKVCLCYH